MQKPVKVKIFTITQDGFDEEEINKFIAGKKVVTLFGGDYYILIAYEEL
jgi:hypothetical protein